MQNPDGSPRLPFVAGELLFHVEGGTRDIETMSALAALVEAWGGSLDLPPRPGDKGARALDEAPPATLLRATFEPADPSGEFERLLALEGELRAGGVGATAQPNWIIGGAGGGPGGGSGAGPGARPIPAEPTPLPLDEALLAPLRAAADEARAPVRLVILDAWNGDRAESARFLAGRPLLHALNDLCLDRGVPSDRVPLPNGRRAHQVDDPFPMPDHGVFAAHLAASVVGEERLALSERLLGGAPRPPGVPGDGFIAVEGWRVLDEFGVGDSEALIRALDALAASIGEGERVVVNMSLVVTIPDIPPAEDRLPGLWREAWGPVPPEAFIARLPRNAPPDAERLDLPLYRAVQRLRDAGALLVAASGNDSRGPDVRYAASYPAAYDEVLSVTAATHNGSDEAWYANLAAPGGVALYAGDATPTEELDPTHPLVGPFTDERVPIKGDNNDPLNETGAVAWAGTSFAAPQASGLAALLWAGSPAANANEIAGRLRALADRTLPHRDEGQGTPFIPLLRY